MDRLNEIIQKAKSYYSSSRTGGKIGTGSSGELILDHCLRTFELVGRLSKTSEIPPGSVDEDVLVGCAMFHDAGWMELMKDNMIHPSEIFSRPADSDILHRSWKVVEQELGKILDSRLMERAYRSITEITRPSGQVWEGVLLADADNLDNFGVIGALYQYRSGQASLKSFRQLLDGWHRQQEYHYWDARCRSTLHLEASRKIAQIRLDSMRRFYDQLQNELELTDVDTVFEASGSEEKNVHFGA